MNRISKKEQPSKRFEQDFFNAVIAGENLLSNLVRQGAQVMLQRGLELEISEFLERGYYQRNGNCELKGYRNGYEKGRLNFTEVEEVLTCLRFPEEHRRRICSTNLLERLIKEGKRRTNAVGRFPNENSCLTLVYSVLIDASRSWHGVKMTVEIFQELTRLLEKIRPKSNVGLKERVSAAV